MIFASKTCESAPIDPPTKKSKGRQVGSFSYTEGDLTGMMDSIEEILPVSEAEWQKASDHFNAVYSSKWSRPSRNASAIKIKFRELSHGPTTGGGGCTPTQKRAKDIEKLIDSKAGVYQETSVVDGASQDFEEGDLSSSSSTPQMKREMKRTRLGFEAEVEKHLKQQVELRRQDAELSQRRHEERMSILKELVGVLGNLASK